MPELPEVETIARQLRSDYLGHTIVRIETRPARIFRNISPEEFKREIEGKRIESISRYGKFLIWKTDHIYPVFHLGMSGIFIKNKTLSNYPKHIHIAFKFSNSSNLYFQDVRKFGKILLFRQPPEFDNLGVDPLSSGFSLDHFSEILRKSKLTIKSFLMDQNKIAGIGNIYANEALFLAGINPFLPANRLTKVQIKLLFSTIIQVLNDALDNFGTTYSAYQTVEGATGENQNFLKIYQREGEPCFSCSSVIQKKMINNRSTFFCPKCQEFK